jgi:CRISPR-associated protein Csd1
MILQALHDYYLRRCADADPANRLPAFGLELKEIPFILELDTTGRLCGITDTRQLIGKKKVGTSRLVPKGIKKTSGVAANLLWDTAEYVLGCPAAKKDAEPPDAAGSGDRAPRLKAMQEAFQRRIQTLPESARLDVAVQAVLAFLAADPLAAAARFEAFAEIAASNPVLTFRLVGDTDLVCQRPAVAAGLTDEADADDTPAAASTGICLVTGEAAVPARLHSAIKGVWGAQTSGANIVSFNLDAFNSQGRQQGANAPVGQAAAFAYTTALNALLARDSRQRMQVGDASTVFWSQRDDPFTGELAALFGGDDPDRHAQQVRALYASIQQGAFDGERGDNRFFALGLAPNAARIAIRFWHAGTLRDMAGRIGQWFDDLQLDGSPKDARHPGLFRLLTAVAQQGKAENIPPQLGGDLLRSILAGTPYPITWLQAAVRRCRAEQQVNHLRAASIKACLRRLDSR